MARGADGSPTDPFAPPPWERADADGTFGNRFDDPGKVDGIPEEKRFRIVYAAAQRDGAFAETIAYFRPDLAALAALGTIRGAMGEAAVADWRGLRPVV
ncbi:MAG: RES domain-containing protein [Chloroflexota bacterium]|nr:RES domain-containing protein [Chloroflexota bacterium]